MKLSDYVWKEIARYGVKHVFMLPGGGAMHLNDSLGSNPDIEYIPCLHENTASVAACAYGQYTNRLGVCHVTTGPGGTNALTGCAAAWMDSIPVLYVSGAVARSNMQKSGMRSYGLQEVDIISMAQSVTKFSARVMRPESIYIDLQTAIVEAKSGRPGPTWIDIPLDIQAVDIEDRPLNFDRPFLESEIIDVTPVIDALRKAKRPVIIAGGGIQMAGAEEHFRQLARKLNIPVVLTWKSFEFLDHYDPLNVGRLGPIGNRWANWAVMNSDFLLSIGCKLDQDQTGYNQEGFAPHADKFIVDVCDIEIDKLRFPHTGYYCDAGDFILSMLEEDLPTLDVNDWHKTINGWKVKYQEKREVNGVDMYKFIHRLSDFLCTPDDVLAPGSAGISANLINTDWRLKLGQRLIKQDSLGSMGFAIGNAIGAHLASGRRVISMSGDGGFMQGIEDLQTIAVHNYPVKMFVLDNQGYGSIRETQRRYFDSHWVACTNDSVPLPDIGRIVSAFDIPFVRIDELGKTPIKKLMEHEGPMVCVVSCDPNQINTPRLKPRLENGKFISAGIEDQWPWLEREELAKVMEVGNG